jgi:hypothetical protein
MRVRKSQVSFEVGQITSKERTVFSVDPSSANLVLSMSPLSRFLIPRGALPETRHVATVAVTALKDSNPEATWKQASLWSTLQEPLEG